MATGKIKRGWRRPHRPMRALPLVHAAVTVTVAVAVKDGGDEEEIGAAYAAPPEFALLRSCAAACLCSSLCVHAAGSINHERGMICGVPWLCNAHPQQSAVGGDDSRMRE